MKYGQFQNDIPEIGTQDLSVDISCFKSEIIGGRRRTSIVKFSTVLTNADYNFIKSQYEGWQCDDDYLDIAPIIMNLFSNAGFPMYRRSPLKVTDIWTNGETRIEFHVRHMHYDKICMEIPELKRDRQWIFEQTYNQMKVMGM